MFIFPDNARTKQCRPSKLLCGLRTSNHGPLLFACRWPPVAYAMSKVLRMQNSIGHRTHVLCTRRKHLLQRGLLQVCF